MTTNTKIPVATEKTTIPFLAVIYDCLAEKPESSLISAATRHHQPILRPMLTIGLPPKNAANSPDGLAKESRILQIKLGANLKIERSLWDEALLLPHVQNMINIGTLVAIEPNNDGEPGFARYAVTDLRTLVSNFLLEEEIDAYLIGETRKEVFKLCEEQKARIKAMREAQQG